MPKRARKGNGAKEGENKSQLIRDTYKKLGPGTRPRDVIAALAEQGVVVSRALVTNVLVRAKVKKGTAPGRRGRRPAPETVSMEALLNAKRMVEEVGSIDEAKRALDALARLM